jgi:hypothetical protein
MVYSYATAHGLRLAASEIEFTVLRAGVLRGEIGFAELRVWFAGRLRPIGST